MSIGQDLVQGIIKEAIYNHAKKAVVKAIITKLPFLGLLSPIIGMIVGKILNIVYEHVWRAVSFAMTDFEVETQRRAYEGAVAQLKEALAKENVSNEELEKAKQEFKDKFRDIVKFPTNIAK